jgi:hypothetical protein
MDDKRHSQWQRLLTVAYQRPLSQRWRRDDVQDHPGPLFDALVIATCVLLAAGLYFGAAGVIGALLFPLPFFALWKARKRRPPRRR